MKKVFASLLKYVKRALRVLLYLITVLMPDDVDKG